MAGFVVWFTGLSGSGKSTLATMVAARLAELGIHAQILDGDEIRRNLSRGLGFSKEDRYENLRRVGFVAKVVARAGACAIAAAISPYREQRDEVRAENPRFCEVYCECPIDVLAERDPKGLYKKALRGEIKNFTGIDDPYEAPVSPDIVVRTDHEAPEQSAARILERLRELGFIENATRLYSLADRPLVNLVTQGAAAEGGVRRASERPTIELDAEALALARLMAIGALTPLSGFMTSRELHCVKGEGRLENGRAWTEPVSATLTDDEARKLGGAKACALLTADGQPFGSLDGLELWRDAEGRQRIAGQLHVHHPPEGLTAPGVTKSWLSDLGARRVAAQFLAPSPTPGELRAMRAALTLHDALLVFHDQRLPAPVSDLNHDEAARVSTIALPSECYGKLGLRSCIAYNYGASGLLWPDDSSAAGVVPWAGLELLRYRF